MKKFKKLLSFALVFAMICSVSIPASASGVTLSESGSISANEGSTIVVTDNGIYIDGIFYTPDEFAELLDEAVRVDTP